MAEAVTVGATLRTGWPVLVIPSAIYFVSHFHRIALGVVAQDLMRAFTITAATLGALAAIYPYVFVAMALVAGSLADTLGPRRTLGAGALAMGLGALVFGLAPSFSVVVRGRLVVSIGASVILIAFLTLAAERFRGDDFATISGLTQTVGNLGGLAAAGPLALLVEAIGWRASYEAIGAATVALAVVAVLGVRERRDPRPRTVSRSVRDVVVGVPGIVLNPRTWPPVLAGAGMYSTVIALQGLWGVSYLTQVHGLPRVQAAADIAWMAVGVMVGAPRGGGRGPRGGPPPAAIPGVQRARRGVLAAARGPRARTADRVAAGGVLPAGLFVERADPRVAVRPRSQRSDARRSRCRLLQHPDVPVRRADAVAHRSRARCGLGGARDGGDARLFGHGVPRRLRPLSGRRGRRSCSGRLRHRA